MATIALYADKINQMPGLIRDVKKSVLNYKAELSALKNKSLKINQSICNMDDVVSSIQASSQTQEEKAASLEAIQKNSKQFIEDTARIDSEVADAIRQRKDDFYEQYNYLKPDIEKNWIENKLDKAGEWCKKNWKSITKIIVTVVVIAILGIATALTGGVLGVIIAGAFWGALSGALFGGIVGGVTSVINGGTFLAGFADGALSGAIEGAITGAVFAGVGLAVNAIKNARFVTKVSKMSNFKKGKAFSEKVGKILGKSAKGEVHINLNNGARFRADFIKQGRFTKKFHIYEVKSSATAKFTQGQFRSFAQNGNKLVDFGRFAGKGKSIFGDVLIGKGTIIHVIRPADLLTLGAKINISIPAGIFGGGITTLFSGLQSD